MIRNAAMADRKALYDLHSAKVSLEKNDEMEFYFSRLLKMNNVIVNEIDGHVAAAVQVNSHTMMLNDKRLAVGTIIGAASSPGHPEYLQELLEDVMDEQSRKNLVTLALADKATMYRKLGFEEVYKKRVYTIKSTDLNNASYQGVSREFIISDLDQAYRRFAGYFNGYYLRDKQYRVELYKQLAFLRCNLCVYRGAEGEVEGYMIYHLAPQRICVDELVYLNGEAFIRLLCYGFRYKEEMELTVSQDEEIRRLVPKVTYRSVNTFLARINDMKLFNRLYGSEAVTSAGGFYLTGKSLLLNEWC